ncbi:MAG: pyruvate, phosphate dikinase, partial [Puniceicoccales bacterium]|nr:pyruvate, phosphate dikinase [Puniceicoccales bacterium]
MATKTIYEFGKKTDGNASMRDLLGGKGANLAEMSRIGLPVPPGFTITTEVCREYYQNNKTLPNNLKEGIREAVKTVEDCQGKKFGDVKNPLLFSVRSGARESMPGMMDTILNLGLNDETVEGLAAHTNNPRFAYDCYRRFIQMYGDVVMGVAAETEEDTDPFDAVLEARKRQKGVQYDNNLAEEDLRGLVGDYKKLIEKHTGTSFPQEVYEQLYGAIGAVFESWQNQRAIIYRRKYNIPSEWGTAVNIQTMVFGNSGNLSATGVAFTRNPANGAKEFYGEYLINAQGEDVVAGIRTPNPIALLEKEMPRAHAELLKICRILESHFKDMQDFEFTVEDDRLYMLQTRNGKRTGLAAVKIAVDMVDEGLIDKKTAVKRISAESVGSLLVPVFDREGRRQVKSLTAGLPAGPGAASGKVVFSASRAEEWSERGEKVILCRLETSPEDIRGMLASEGILTARGGVSSHAALVARQMGKVCVCGAGEIRVDYRQKTFSVGEVVIKEGDFISIDGTTGEVFEGSVRTMPSEVIQVLNGTLDAGQSDTYRLFDTVMKWSDEFRRLGIRTNADTPEQAKRAVQFGADGIGLCRTEHMFFEGHRIDFMREMILADTEEDRRRALDKLLPLQKGDFVGLFREMKGLPVTIRLLDPPLHEFVPHEEEAVQSFSKASGISVDKIKARVKALSEQNPMLGHRGCRLGIAYSEITEMQAQAIFEAAAEVSRMGIPVKPEVMIPLVGFVEEFKHQAECVRSVAQRVQEANGVSIPYLIGTMIEIPRAALQADEIAQHAEFFSFGTNDLTQMTLGISRDDMGNFYNRYLELEIFKQNPFATIEVRGVGQLVQMGVERGLKGRANLKVGVCGEHGGDPESVKFFHRVGLHYVS